MFRLGTERRNHHSQQERGGSGLAHFKMDILHQLGALFLEAAPTVVIVFLFYFFMRWAFFTPIQKAMAERSARISFLPYAAVRLAGALIAGEAIIFLGGCGWLASGMGLGRSHAFQAGALPFLPGEIIKMALILAAVRGVELARRPR